VTDSAYSPRTPEIIRAEILDLESAGLSSKQWLVSHPNDRVVSLLVEQDQNRTRQLLQELEDSLRQHRRHQFVYSIKTDGKVEISDFGYLVSSFKGAIAATSDTVSTKAEMPLYFEALVHGSFGVLLSTDWDPELIATRTQRTFTTFFEILNALQDGGLPMPTVLSSNKPLLRKYRTFYRSITTCNYPIQLTWRSFDKEERRETLITESAASRIFRFLANTERPQLEDVQVTGSVQGVSLIDLTMQFVPFRKEGTRIKVFFDGSFREKLRHLLGETATIVYRVSEDYNPDDDTTISRKTLLRVL
jgi:hypothetical protein